MSNPNFPSQAQNDARYSKPADVAAAITTQATTDAGQYLTKPILDATGATNVVPALQALYDSGVTVINLQANGTYLFDSALFLDSSDVYSKFTIHGNGSKIKLGANLPTTTAFTPDTSTQWAIFVNNLRSALSSGVVTCNTSTRGTGSSVGGLTRLIVRDLTILGQSANRGFTFGNRTAVNFENVTLQSGRALASWYDYADGWVLDHCFNRAGTGAVTDSFLLYQISNGDGIIMTNPKADTGLGITKMLGCNGAEINAPITGTFVFDSCKGISISGAHQEADLSPTVQNITVKRSQVTIDASVIFPAKAANAAAALGAITIDDSAGTAGSDLTIRDSDAHYFYRLGELDLAIGPLVDMVSVQSTTRVRFERVTNSVVTFGLGGIWPQSVSLPVRATDTGLTAAIAAAIALLATGRFEIAMSTSGAWQVFPAGRSVRAQVIAGAPTIAQLYTNADGISGTLTSGTTYEYAAAALDYEGNYSAASAAINVAADTNGAIRLLIDVAAAPTGLVLWRKAATGVLAAPDAYVIVPAGSYRVRLYDTGANVGGIPWITSSVPIAATVAASAHGREALILPSGSTFFPNTHIKKTSTTTFTSSTSYLTIIAGTLDMNATTEFEAFIVYEAGTTGKIKIGLAYPNSSSGLWSAGGPGSAATATAAVEEFAFLTQTGEAYLGGLGAGVQVVARVKGYIITGATGGAFGIKAAQYALDSTSTIVTTNSRMNLRRVA